MVRSLLVGASLACFAVQSSLALSTISVKGAKLFAGGQQFYIKGVAYQGTPTDPLIDTAQCLLDAKSMQTIGTNSIRVYHIDPSANHDGCMKAFSDVGIYIWLDVDTFDTSVVQAAPAWTQAQFLRYAAVMDTMQKYDNVAGFWIGNEVISSLTGSPAAPYIKAAVTDMKTYMAAKKYRSILIGYSAADIAELRPMLQNYLACGSTQSQSIDFYGLNSYEWCGSATYQTSGYSGLQAMSQNYSIPIFFSETGCNVGGQRTFNDQGAIFGPDMSNTWSGSIIYEWVEETNAYGLVNYPDGQIYSGAPIPIQPDFDNLSSAWKNVKPTAIAEANYTPSFSAPACPTSSGGWQVNGNVPLPTLDQAIISSAVGGSLAAPTHPPIPSYTGTKITSFSMTVSTRSTFTPTPTPSSSPISSGSSTSIPTWTNPPPAFTPYVHVKTSTPALFRTSIPWTKKHTPTREIYHKATPTRHYTITGFGNGTIDEESIPHATKAPKAPKITKPAYHPPAVSIEEREAVASIKSLIGSGAPTISLHQACQTQSPSIEARNTAINTESLFGSGAGVMSMSPDQSCCAGGLEARDEQPDCIRNYPYGGGRVPVPLMTELISVSMTVEVHIAQRTASPATVETFATSVPTPTMLASLETIDNDWYTQVESWFTTWPTLTKRVSKTSALKVSIRSDLKNSTGFQTTPTPTGVTSSAEPVFTIQTIDPAPMLTIQTINPIAAPIFPMPATSATAPGLKTAFGPDVPCPLVTAAPTFHSPSTSPSSSSSLTTSLLHASPTVSTYTTTLTTTDVFPQGPITLTSQTTVTPTTSVTLAVLQSTTAAPSAVADTKKKSSSPPSNNGRNPIQQFRLLTGLFGVGGEIGFVIIVVVLPVLVGGFL